MSVRSLNFTGRNKIPLEAISINVAEHESGYRISGTVDLGQVPGPQGELVVEVYHRSQRKRLLCGRHSGVAEVEGVVPKFASLLSLRCNVRVVSTTGLDRGKILAAKRHFKPQIDGDASGREGLIDFVPFELGQVLWAMDYGVDQEPRVLVNSALNWQALCKTAEFRLLVMPEIARGAARWVWDVRDTLAIGDSATNDAWVDLFRKLGADLVEYQDGESAQSDWVDAAVNAHADKFRFVESWLGRQEEE